MPHVECKFVTIHPILGFAFHVFLSERMMQEHCEAQALGNYMTIYGYFFEEVVVVDDDSTRLCRVHAASNSEGSCTTLIIGVDLLVDMLMLERKGWKGSALISRNEFEESICSLVG